MIVVNSNSLLKFNKDLCISRGSHDLELCTYMNYIKQFFNFKNTILQL